MATLAPHATQSAVIKPSLPGRRFDHFFFSGMVLLSAVTVFVGFAHTYYLAGLFRAPLPARIIHFHGAAFSCWIVLLLAQASLVSTGRVDIHKRLGILGFFLACAMVILGVLAATNALVRNQAPPGLDARTFYVIPMTDMFNFAVLIFLAFRARSNPAAHKRLILVATISLLVAAIARWPFAFVYKKPLPAMLLSYLFLLLIAAYDFWSTRKIHRATFWGGVFVIFMQLVRLPIGQTPAWQSFASWVERIAQ
jgi:hypothetical protein